MKKKVLIIGAGIAGLSAGCYLQMNGYDTEIFEMNTIPGGLCTSWDKKGFTIDGCLHWLVGSGSGDPFYPLWNELIDMKNLNFVYKEITSRVYDNTGKYIDFYSDLNKLRVELLAKAPEDEKAINELIDTALKFSDLNLPVDKPYELMTIFDYIKFSLKFIPYISDFNKYIKITSTEYSKVFKNPLLRFALENMFVPDMSHIFNIFILCWFHKRTSGYPIGGSLNFAEQIEARYKSLGGKVQYHSKVKSIITSEEGTNNANGIQLDKGTVINGDIIISAADGYYTIYKMLGGKYKDSTIDNYYSSFKVFPSIILVSLGVNRLFDGTPSTQTIQLYKRIKTSNNESTDILSFRIYSDDSTLAPEGKTLITVLLTSENHEYWCGLRKNEIGKYHEEKERIAGEVIQILEKHLGNIENNIEMTDIATPATIVRYTNNWKGSFEGWILTPQTGYKSLKKELPGLKNFYMIGQWVEPGGGVPAALLSARNITQLICHRDKLKFKTQSFLDNKS